MTESLRNQKWRQIYRGHDSEGLGEVPGAGGIAMFGEQYLDASDKLWTGAPAGFHDYAVAWMTLEANDDDRVEAWSYFGFPAEPSGKWDYRFAVRLFSNGLFRERRAYLAHAWGWETPGYIQAEDPGRLIGHSQAFSGPKRPASFKGPHKWFDSEVPPEANPEIEWRELFAPRPDVAKRLMAYLYRACAGGSPVVMAVPREAFREDGTIGKLVSFARAGLPAEFKRDCRIRVNTNSPALFLQDKKAHLVVIPEAAAVDARRADPNAVLLDQNAMHVDLGAEPGSDIAKSGWFRYSEEVIERFLNKRRGHLFGPALYLFSARVGSMAGLAQPREPDERALASAHTLYDLIALRDDAALMEKMVRYSLENPAAESRPWEYLLTQGPLEVLSPQTIRELGSYPVKNEDAATLMRCVFAEALKRGIAIDPPLDAAADRVLEHLAAGLIEPGAAAKLIACRPASEVFDLLDSKKTSMSSAPVAFVEVIGALDFGTGLPAEWEEKLPVQGTAAEAAERLLNVALAYQRYFKNRSQVWSTPLFAALSRVLSEPGPLPEAVAPMASQLATTAFRKVEDLVIVAELLFRTGAPATRLLDDLVKQIDEELFDRRRSRRWVSANSEDKQWKLLRQFEQPADWDEDCRDIALESISQLKKLDVERVISMAASTSPQPMPTAVIRILDENLEAELAMVRAALDADDVKKDQFYLKRALRTTCALISQGQWLRWRVATSLAPQACRDAAKAWLLDCRTTRPVLLEDWKQCMKDLREDGISGEEFAQLRRNPYGRIEWKWPLLPLFQESQRKDLYNRAGDYGALAEIAETASSYEAVEKLMRAKDPKTAEGFLAPLERGEKGSLDLDGLRKLWKGAGHRKPEALRAIITATLQRERIKSDPDGVIAETGGEPDLWASEEFVRRLLGLLMKTDWTPSDQFLSKVDSRLMNCDFAVTVEEQFGPGLKARSEWFRQRSYVNIANLLARAALKGEVIDKACESLKNGTAQISQAWQEISFLASRAKLDPDPLIEILNTLRRGTTKAFTIAAEFDKICLSHPSLLYHNQGRVPAFEIFALIRPNESLGEVTRKFLSKPGIGDRAHKWWDGLIESMRMRVKRDDGYRDGLDSALLRLAVAVDGRLTTQLRDARERLYSRSAAPGNASTRTSIWTIR